VPLGEPASWLLVAVNDPVEGSYSSALTMTRRSALMPPAVRTFGLGAVGPCGPACRVMISPPSALKLA
jgi:hypothetical protein